MQKKIKSAEILQYKQKPSNHYQIEQLVLDDLRKKILNDEMNRIQFYDIIQPDINDVAITNLKDTIKKPLKLYRKIKRSDLEAHLRNKLIDEPGGKLLLQEIYEKLEEDDNLKIASKGLHREEQFKGNRQYQVESDEAMVANLDQWWKQVKRNKQQAIQQKQVELEKEKQLIAATEKAKLIQQTQIVQLRRGGVEKRSGTSIGSQFPKLSKEDSHDLQSPEIETGSLRNLFKVKVQQSLQKIASLKKAEHLKEDIGLVKELDKYMQQGSTLTQQELLDIEQARQKQSADEKQNDTLIFDYTVEGLKNSLHTRIKMKLTNFINANERAIFYEKQTNSILQQINNKHIKQKKMVQKNDTDLEMLRTQTHEMYEKVRQIQELIVQLKDELSKVGNNNNINNKSQLKVSSVDFYMATVGKQNEVESQIEQMKDSQKKYKLQIKFNSKQIEKLENENTKLNKNNKELLKSIQGFLLELLRIGLDCRQQGLCWIVKSCWDSHQQVNDDNFPQYLDSKAKEFLIQKTKRIIELNDLFYKAHELFGNYHGRGEQSSLEMNSQLNSSIYSMMSKKHFSGIDTEDIKRKTMREKRLKSTGEINLLLNGLGKSERLSIQKTIHSIYESKQTLNDILYSETQKKLQQIFKTDISMLEQSILGEEKEKLLLQYANIQKEIKQKEQQFKKFEDTELIRIVKEIEFKKYLQRFSVEPLQVLSALFGYLTAERELIKQGMIHITT